MTAIIQSQGLVMPVVSHHIICKIRPRSTEHCTSDGACIQPWLSQCNAFSHAAVRELSRHHTQCTDRQKCANCGRQSRLRFASCAMLYTNEAMQTSLVDTVSIVLDSMHALFVSRSISMQTKERSRPGTTQPDAQVTQTGGCCSQCVHPPQFNPALPGTQTGHH